MVGNADSHSGSDVLLTSISKAEIPNKNSTVKVGLISIALTNRYSYMMHFKIHIGSTTCLSLLQ